MHPKNRATIALAALLLFFAKSLSLAQESFPFQAEVIDSNINIRSDSTVSSPVICQVNKGQRLTVAFEHYNWYKVRLPKDTPVFIKDDFVAPLDSKTARVTKDRVNIRLGPGNSSPVIGMAKKEEILNVLGRTQGWYKIEPLDSCFGWINKQFTKKLTDMPKPIEQAKTQDIARVENKIGILDNPSKDSGALTVIGIINPYGMVLKRITTHKIITGDKKIFLLKGDKENLNALTYRKVKITGKVISKPQEKYPIIEVNLLEALD